MNEQLVVKNFGPIKDATVDFKRVTVFIGPTGGGKSTLAKLAAIYRDGKQLLLDDIDKEPEGYVFFNIKNHFESNTDIRWVVAGVNKITSEYKDNKILQRIRTTSSSILSSEALQDALWFQRIVITMDERIAERKMRLKTRTDLNSSSRQGLEQSIVELQAERKTVSSSMHKHIGLDEDTLNFYTKLVSHIPYYIPAERQIIPALNQSWPDLLRLNVAFPKILLDFARSFLEASANVRNLTIPFLNVDYEDNNGINTIHLLASQKALPLSETASGIQSVTPLLVMLEHLSRNTEQAQSFIIEEPELNLFPTAQFELVKILVDKCARLDEQNDLVLTTHSPYVLTALNLLCYAFRIAQQDEATAKKVAKLVPRHCWIDPDQFAAYYVDRPDTKHKQQVRSIINKKTGLIEENELDTASDELSDIFDKLVKLRKPSKIVASAK